MSIIFEIGTKNYSNDLLLVKKALSHMETLTGNYGSYAVSEPSSRFGWTFFKLSLGPELEGGIREKFSDMIDRYRWSSQDEKFTKFLNDYFHARGCEVKLRKLD